MLLYGITINLVLASFNLIPIPPLEGSHVMKYQLPVSWSIRYVQFGRAGIVIILGVMYLAPGAFGYWLRPAFAVGNMMIHTVSPVTLFAARQWIP